MQHGSYLLVIPEKATFLDCLGQQQQMQPAASVLLLAGSSGLFRQEDQPSPLFPAASLGNPVDELIETLSEHSSSSSPASSKTVLPPHPANFLDKEEPELLPRPDMGGGRLDRSGESASKAARLFLSLAVTAIATIGSVSRGPAKLVEKENDRIE